MTHAAEIETLRSEVAQLRAELNRQDEWAMGLFQVLLDVLPELLRHTPCLAEKLEPNWRKVAERFDVLNQATSLDPNETPERLEPRKQLYRLLAIAKAWPAPRAAK